MSRSAAIGCSISGILLTLLFAFNNCGQEVSFGTAESLGKNSNLADEVSDPPSDDIDDRKDEIADACMNGDLQEATYEVDIPDPGVTCAWGEDGNLSRSNQYFRARVEQSFDFNLPENSKICGLSFEFEEQNFVYDDHFMFVFNDVVLASSYDFSSKLSSVSGLHLYDWDEIVGMYWDNRKEGVYCASVDGSHASGLCSWPDTEVPGTIVLGYSEDLIHTVMALEPNRETHSFSMVTIGDNDGRDCEHSDIHFEFGVKYVVK